MENFIELNLPNCGKALISVSSIAVLEDLKTRESRVVLKEREKSGENISTFTADLYQTIKDK